VYAEGRRSSPRSGGQATSNALSSQAGAAGHTRLHTQAWAATQPLARQRQSAAARVVTNTLKYDRGLLCTMRHDLHWLDMTECVQFRIAMTVYLHGRAPEYLSELCIPVNHRSSRYRLRSSQNNQLIVPAVKLSTYGPRSFAVAGPTIWNNVPEYLRDPELSMDNFRHQLKTFLIAQY